VTVSLKWGFSLFFSKFLGMLKLSLLLRSSLRKDGASCKTKAAVDEARMQEKQNASSLARKLARRHIRTTEEKSGD
jgi:hypothetical protein